MSRKSDFVKHQWRWVKRLFVLFCLCMAVMMGLNIWRDADNGKPFDYGHIWDAASMIALAVIVICFCGLVYKFMFAWTSHEERHK